MPETSVRTVVVVLPPGIPADWSRISTILTPLVDPPYTPHAAYPLRCRLTRRSQRDLLDPARRPDGDTRAAGGRLSRLDLPRLADTAHQNASFRWSTWNTQVARATPLARGWESFHADHVRAPHKLSLTDARRKFEAQPRVLAMLALNAHPAAPFTLKVEDLTALQAGQLVYTTLYWQQALAGHALATPDGQLLQSASDTLADRLRYLQHATALLHRLTPDHHLAALHTAQIH